MEKDKAKNVSSLSNTAAAMISGGLVTIVSNWDGQLSFISGDFTQLKTLILVSLPAFGMFCAHHIQNLGYKYYLGSKYRRLSRINKKRIAKIKKILKDKDLTKEKREDFQNQLGDLYTDDLNIHTKEFKFVEASINTTEKNYTEHAQNSPYENQQPENKVQES